MMAATATKVLLVVCAGWALCVIEALVAPRALPVAPAARRAPTSLLPRMLFSGAPPEPAPAPASGGKTMTIPGLGQVSEEEMRLAMEFRRKMAERMASIVVEATALGGKVKISYDGQGQPVKVEIADDALKQGEAAIGAAVVEAAKKAQQDSIVKMKQTMQSMQQEIAQTLQAQERGGK